MKLTGVHVSEKRGLIKGELLNYQIQQVGIDLKVESVKSIRPCWWKRLFKKKILTLYLGLRRIDLSLYKEVKTKEGIFVLKPGFYSLTFTNGVSLPNDISMSIQPRSTLARVGCIITTGQYDPGFCVEKVGCVIYIPFAVRIEKGCCVVQAIFEKTEFVPDMYVYNGQYQGGRDFK